MTDVIDPHVLRRYDVCQKIGQGAYGIVWKAIHKRSGATVALKKCFEAFRCNSDAQRTFREVMYLQALSNHKNIVKIQNVVRADNDKDLYLVFDFMDTDLNQVIRAKILEDMHMRYITYQLLKALKYIHSAKLLHRDVKPSNLLIDVKCNVKLCDFGLCRSIANNEATEDLILTDYVATRWYRSPEILMGSKKYTEGLDLWSVGCILGEMYRSRPLFPGTSTMNQLEKIFEVTGNPTVHDITSWRSPFAASIVENVMARSHVKLDDLCHDLPSSAKHLMQTLFQLDPSMRGTAETALGHEYLSDFHNPESEVTYPYGPIKIDFDDNRQLSAEKYRRRLYQFIDERKEQSRRSRYDHEHERKIHLRNDTAMTVSSDDSRLSGHHERKSSSNVISDAVRFF